MKIRNLAIAAMFVFGISAHASVYTAPLTGAQEVGPTGSPATGFVTVTILGDTLTVDLSYTGLIGGNPAAAHIHCCAPIGTNVGVAVGFPGFPTTTSGTYNHAFNLLDPTVYTSAFLSNFGGGTAAGAEAALIAGLNTNLAYSNIHNATFPGGEIRGNLAAVPEPCTLVLVGLSLTGLLFGLKHRISA